MNLNPPPPKRNPVRIFADILRLERAARLDPECVPIEEALEGAPARRWAALMAEIRQHVADQPS